MKSNNFLLYFAILLTMTTMMFNIESIVAEDSNDEKTIASITDEILAAHDAIDVEYLWDNYFDDKTKKDWYKYFNNKKDIFKELRLMTAEEVLKLKGTHRYVGRPVIYDQNKAKINGFYMDNKTKKIVRRFQIYFVKENNKWRLSPHFEDQKDSNIFGNLPPSDETTFAMPENVVDDFFMTIINNDVEKVKTLLSVGGVDVNAKNKDGRTALIEAAMEGHVEVVRLLLENKADVNEKITKACATALMAAACNGHTETVKLLLENKADINAETSNGGTALQYAAYKGHIEVVKLLLENKADVNAKIVGGRTALMAAAEKGYSDIVKLLLENKADVNAKTEDGLTALRIAIDKEHAEVVKLLKAAGAVGVQESPDLTK